MTLIEWVITPTYSAACSFAIEHAAELLHGGTDLALDELDLRAGETVTAHEHQFVAAARDSDFEEVYRPYVVRECARDISITISTRKLSTSTIMKANFSVTKNSKLRWINLVTRTPATEAESPWSSSPRVLLEQALTAIGDRDQFAALVSRAALDNARP